MFSKFRLPKGVLWGFLLNEKKKKRHDFKLIRLKFLLFKTYSEKDALRKIRTSIFSFYF